MAVHNSYRHDECVLAPSNASAEEMLINWLPIVDAWFFEKHVMKDSEVRRVRIALSTKVGMDVLIRQVNLRAPLSESKRLSYKGAVNIKKCPMKVCSFDRHFHSGTFARNKETVCLECSE